MSCSTGPNIVTSGLICDIDFSNKKSFSGIGSDRVGGISPTFGSWGGLTGSSVSYTSKYGPGVFLQTITGGGVNYWYSNYGNQACSSSTQYIVTARIKYVGSSTSPSANLFYVRQFNSSGAQTSESGKFSTSQMIALGNDWYMAYAYFTTDSTAVNFYIHGYEYSAGMYIFIEDLQCKLAGVTDITNKNTITANSLAYNSDGTFSFNGSNYISFPSIDFSNEQTIEIWLKPTENDSARRNPYNQAYGGYGTWTHEPDGTINYYYGDAGSNASPYIGHNSSFTVAQNEIACVCTTRNTSESRWYKNGVYSNNYVHSFGTLTTDGNTIIIGNGYAGYYVGNIYAIKLYNRALSAAEVKQNFNAIRGRYGI